MSQQIDIKFCPNCKTELRKHKDHAQGVKYCPECNGIFYILVTGEIQTK